MESRIITDYSGISYTHMPFFLHNWQRQNNEENIAKATALNNRQNRVT